MCYGWMVTASRWTFRRTSSSSSSTATTSARAAAASAGRGGRGRRRRAAAFLLASSSAAAATTTTTSFSEGRLSSSSSSSSSSGGGGGGAYSTKRRLLRERPLRSEVAAARELQAREDGDVVAGDGSATMEGSCAGSVMEAGQQRGTGSYLCYPATGDPVHKFGIDSDDRLSYYVDDARIWSAAPPLPDTPECIVFGRDCAIPLRYYRLQNGGSLAAYTADRIKAWDSRLDGGTYSDYAVSRLDAVDGAAGGANDVADEKRSRSVLEVTGDGVFVYDADAGGAVTWRIDAPPPPPPPPPSTATGSDQGEGEGGGDDEDGGDAATEDAAAGSPAAASSRPAATATTTTNPTSRPTTFPPTRSRSPTNRPTRPQTKTPTSSSVTDSLGGAIQGFVWDDTPTGDAVYGPNDSPLSSVPVSLHLCDAVDTYVNFAMTSSDGTFAMDGLEEGSYKIRVVPPLGGGGGGGSLFDDGGGGTRRGWEFVAKGANDGGGGSAAAEDSDVNADGTSDCVVVGPSDDGAWRHSIYAGLILAADGGTDGADEDGKNQEGGQVDEGSTPLFDGDGDGDGVSSPGAIAVSGTVFWDANGDGAMGAASSTSSSNDNPILEGMVVDLYDCDAPDGDSGWLLLTRTGPDGTYEFAVPDDDSSASAGTTANLAAFLETMGTTRFRAVFGLPSSSSASGEKYVFSPSGSGADSDVDPENGSTACWDVAADGEGSVVIVWDAGITASTTTEATTATGTTSRPSAAEQVTPPSMPSPTSGGGQPTPSSSVLSPSSASPSPPTMISGGVVGGYAFLDENDDGIRNPNVDKEPALQNVNVRLFSCAAPPSEEEAPPSSSSSSSGGSDAMAFLDGGSLSSQSTHSKNDAERSGHSEEEQDTLLAMQRTNAQGFYSFRNLFSGYYRVDARPPSGYRASSVWLGSTNTTGTAGGNVQVDNAFDSTTMSTECFLLEGGNTDISWNLGLVPLSSPTSSPADSEVAVDDGDEGNNGGTSSAGGSVVITGMVFNDANKNGYLEDGEAPIPNIQAALFDCNTTTIHLLTTTDENGMYGFEDVEPGSYVVKFSSPGGYKISDVWSSGLDEEGKLAASDATNDADPDTGSTACKEYEAADVAYSLDAGMFVGQSPPSSAVRPTPPTPATSNKPAPAAAATDGPTDDPKGDGTRCSGGKCPVEGMCRNKAGLCGAGIGFCNPNSVWDSSCPTEVETVPVAAPGGSVGKSDPSATPTLSALPGLSMRPSKTAAATTGGGSPSKGTASGTVCNDDGTVGLTESFPQVEVQAAEISFAYALATTDGKSVDPSVVAQFEAELHARLACTYFDDPCLACADDGDEGGGGANTTTVGLRRRLSSAERRGGRFHGGSNSRLYTFYRTRNLVTVENSAVVGISPLPRDVPNPVEVCAGGSTSNCRVIDGKFNAYFPSNLDPDQIEEEEAAMLSVVQDELAKDDWPNGIRVSYDNAPLPAIEATGPTNGSGGSSPGNGGLSTGAIAGIAVGIVALIAIVGALSAILIIRNKRDKEEEKMFEQQRLQLRQLHQERAVDPFGSGEDGQTFESKDAVGYIDESDDSDDDSSDSSSDDSSSSEDDDDDDELGSGSISNPSAISGDTFPSNVAHARPQDLGDESSESSDDEDESEDEEESYDEGSEISDDVRNINTTQPTKDDGGIQRLQQSVASDENNPTIYEEDNNVDGRYDAKQEYARDYNTNDDHQHYGSGNNYNGQGELQYGDGRDESRYDGGQRSEGNYHHQDNYHNDEEEDFNLDDAGSVVSADPPGTSYRDLPQDFNWDGRGDIVVTESVPQQQQLIQNNMNHPMGGFSNEYYDESPQGSFRVYESDGSRGLDDGSDYQSHGGNEDDAHSHPGSYNSNQSGGGGSHGFVASHHSVHSNRSASALSRNSYGSTHSTGSRRSSHTSHSNHSIHSLEEEDDDDDNNDQEQQQDYDDQYGDGGGHYHQDYNDHDNYVDEDDGHHNQYNPPPPSYDHGYDQAVVRADISSAYVEDDNENARYNHYGNILPVGGNGQHGTPGIAGAYIDNHVGYQDKHNLQGNASYDFDEESYHSFNPVPSSNKNNIVPQQQSHPEELDEVSQGGGSAYSGATPIMSNMSSPTAPLPKSRSSSNSRGVTMSNDSPEAQDASYGEEEESITNIFKSLSEIQTRLASKGERKQQEGGTLMPQNDNVVRGNKSRKSPSREDGYASSYQPIRNGGSGGGGGGGWGTEGIVEDASVDGSQISNFAMNVNRNRRPQQGEWMEPVDEN